MPKKLIPLVQSILVALAWVCALPAAIGADWSPTQTLEFIVPAGPGGALDQVGREVQQFFEKTQRSKFQMIVVNKGGGNGKIAFDVLKQKTGDPHYLTINTTGYMSNYLIGNLDMLPHRELTPKIKKRSHQFAHCRGHEHWQPHPCGHGESLESGRD